MKSHYNIILNKSDGFTMAVRAISDDSTTAPMVPSPCPAVITAILEALKAAGPGSSVLSITLDQTLVVDTTGV